MAVVDSQALIVIGDAMEEVLSSGAWRLESLLFMSLSSAFASQYSLNQLKK
jgi:hypothetical protein